ncbi:UDP-3-O-acyl-N-acetylglucosamine deacetylase [Acidisphaera sp. L21]|uniref:UDP-3-O-acyl-N-acetylglucosamine deacetylase n=1 Tax=Acidisphaera sp. L21 TaxID=1641851 RepID=UPI0020B1518D|nr:UDP-3-O-acyl-N-acetylglucosamine deacetylase [Acidisphaera sp. L21]
MDGLPPDFTTIARTRQRTLAAAIGCVGVGLHSGKRVKLELLPAAAGAGIVFRRTDIGPNGMDIPARFDNVTDTRLCTMLSHPHAPDVRVGTVEHVMAALAACGIDNAVVAVDGAEVPVLDGSSAPFIFLLDCAGTVEQDAPTRVIEILRPVRVSDGEAFVELRPVVSDGFEMAVSIDFAAGAIGRQAMTLRLTEESFRRDLAEARTFAMAADIAGLQAAGLALGGSLNNAVVVEGDRVLNPGGLRMADEFVRHKMLDAVGDLAMAGAPLKARLVAHRPGHALNNKVLRALFADRSAWTWADAPSFAGWGAVPMAAAAAPV